MKRDLDLVRLILLEIEASGVPYFEGILQIEGYDDGVVNHHVALLCEAEFIRAYELNDANTEFGYLMQDPRLLWEGYELLENIRDGEVWKKTKDGASSVGGWTISIIKELAQGYLKQKARDLGLPIA